MDVFIVLYRGINVGGENPVKLESLRAMHERLGHQGAKSYIQTSKAGTSPFGSITSFAGLRNTWNNGLE